MSRLRTWVSVLALGGVFAGARQLSAESGAIPYFARRYGVDCVRCHVLPPKLNAFGEAFIANGYRMPGLESRGTVPLALWLSGRVDRPSLDPVVQNRVKEYFNRIEVISGGPIVSPGLSYFAEWRPLSFEPRADGTLRDRSGRFEDLFLAAALDKVEVMVGQFRQVQQVDVSRRLSLSEPVVLGASLPGTGGATPRQTSLRGFAPGSRSPGVRAGLVQTLGGEWRWTSAVAVPFPGEISIPLTDEARVEASNELNLSPKGVFAETFVRRGMTSFGAHAFYDNSERYLANMVTSGAYRDAYWTVIGGAAREAGTLRARWSAEGEYVPLPFASGGGRVENLGGDGRAPTFATFVNAHFPGRRYTFRLTVEHRFQPGQNVTFVELGSVF